MSQPPNEAKLWRYMDLSKLVSMLNTKSVWFSRCDRLGDDNFEGSIPRRQSRLMRDQLRTFVGQMPSAQQEHFNVDEMTARKQAMSAAARQNLLVSCWHESEHESAAMWKLYLKSDEGIVVQTTYGRLSASFGASPEPIEMGRVRYIDYESADAPEVDFIGALFCKRKSYEHEREVRGVIVKIDNPDDGVAVDVDLEILVESVRVAPACRAWFVDVVR